MGASWWRASFTYRLLRSSFLLGWTVAGDGLGPAPWLEGSCCARAASRLREGVERAAVRGAGMARRLTEGSCLCRCPRRWAEGSLLVQALRWWSRS